MKLRRGVIGRSIGMPGYLLQTVDIDFRIDEFLVLSGLDDTHEHI